MILTFLWLQALVAFVTEHDALFSFPEYVSHSSCTCMFAILMIYLSKSCMLILAYLDSIPTILLSYLDWGWKSEPLCTCIEWMSTVKLETSGSSEMPVLGILSPSFLTRKFCTYLLAFFHDKTCKTVSCLTSYTTSQYFSTIQIWIRIIAITSESNPLWSNHLTAGLSFCKLTQQ